MSSKQSNSDATPESDGIASSRQTRRRLASAAFLVFAVVVAALLVPIPFMGRASSALGDLVHAPLFGSLALASLWAWQRLVPIHYSSSDRAVHPWRRLFARGLVVWVTLSLFGLTMEILQGGSGRSMSRHDAIANSLGIAAAISGYAAIALRKQRQFRIAAAFVSVAVLILAAAWYRPVTMLADCGMMPSQFPLLGSFESPAEMTRWHFRHADWKLNDRDATLGQHAVEVVFTADDYPAFTLVDSVPDWSGYDVLELDATLDASYPSENVLMLIKIIDHSHIASHSGILQKAVKLRRGQSQRIRMTLADWPTPAGGIPMDWEHIIFLDIGLVRPRFPAAIRFDRLILTN